LNIFWTTENPLKTEEDQKRFPNDLQLLSEWRISPPDLNVIVWVPCGYRNPHTPSHYNDFSIPTFELNSEDIADLFDLDPQREPLGQLLCEIQEKTALAKPRYSFLDMLEVLENDEEIQEYYAIATIRAARQRLRSVSRNPVFGAQNGTPLVDFLKPGILSIIELGNVPNTVRTVIASVLLRRIQTERAAASEAEKHISLNTRLSDSEKEKIKNFITTAIPPSWVIIDEAQNILPANRQVKSSDAVVRFVREGRNFGLSFALTTQQPSAVDQRILAQADTIICHKLTVAGDIARMKENLKCAEPHEVSGARQQLDLAGWLRSLDKGCAIVTNADYERLFAIEIRPRVCPHGGTGFSIN